MGKRWNACGIVLVAAAAACPPAMAALTCPNGQQYRQAFFGELHLHTEYSLDAATLQTRNTPADAYRFARGGKVGLPPFVDTSNGTAPPPAPGAASPAVSAHTYCLPGEKCEHMATRTIQLPKGRALDFAAITDHAEYFGESNICLYEPTRSCSVDSDCNTAAGQTCALQRVCAPKDWADPACILVREEITRLQTGLGTDVFSTYVVTENPQRLPFCADPNDPAGNANCRLQSGALWNQIQNDANVANVPCKFTSFIGYEYTAMPSFKMCGLPNGGGSHEACWDDVDCTSPEKCSLPGSGAANLHRNIIFKGTSVPSLPVTTLEQPTGCGTSTGCMHKQPIASPQALLATLEQTCTVGLPGCEFVSIPHNPNLSGGAMFLLPQSGEEARLRNQYERLVEIMQIKGSSECRFSATKMGAWGTTDENCDFENMSYGRLAGTYFVDPGPTDIFPGSLVRNALKNGMKYQKDEKDKSNIVPNPFQLGFVGALDNHNGTPGATDTAQYARTGAHGIPSFSTLAVALNELNFLGLETNGGGMTGVWAEENTRDSIFAALKRRETFATSGTRPVVRFFGGFDVPADMCGKGNFPAKGYAGGVPMGGTMPALPSQSSKQPTFAVSAVADPGWINHPGTRLQQAQIIKGWVDSTGKTYEKVLTVAGDSKNSGRVNLDTCQTSGTGAHDLCGTWTDNDFSPDQRAFYYARVLENQSCRWNQFACNAIAVDCKKPLGACASGWACDSDEDCRGRDGGQCITPPTYTQYEYQQCCSALVPKTVQQRAWTSPIFYEPM